MNIKRRRVAIGLTGLTCVGAVGALLNPLHANGGFEAEHHDATKLVVTVSSACAFGWRTDPPKRDSVPTGPPERVEQRKVRLIVVAIEKGCKINYRARYSDEP